MLTDDASSPCWVIGETSADKTQVRVMKQHLGQVVCGLQ